MTLPPPIRIGKDLLGLMYIDYMMNLPIYPLFRRLGLCLIFVNLFAPSSTAQHKSGYTLVIHGGAGTILRKQMSPSLEQAYLRSLNQALDLGEKMLADGKPALDVVEAVVRLLEDDSLFNAGKGAVLTNAGEHELDAAIMNGQDLKAGSVAGVKHIKNPITAARRVMENTEHVMLSGSGADEFARQQGLEMVKNSYFTTTSRKNGLERAKQAEAEQEQKKKQEPTASVKPIKSDWKYGTVGAVALDRFGHLAAATSTGGMTNKRYGRIGDAPLIGAGTYADTLVAVSCTGWGEYFIRMVMAKSLADRIRFGNQTLAQAGHDLIQVELPKLGGDGGLIAVDRTGEFILPFCTEGMYRGYVKRKNAESSSTRQVAIYKD